MAYICKHFRMYISKTENIQLKTFLQLHNYYGIFIESFYHYIIYSFFWNGFVVAIHNNGIKGFTPV